MTLCVMIGISEGVGVPGGHDIKRIDMLSTNERIIISALRNAERVFIEIPSADGGVIRVSVTGRKTVHDIAVAVQNHYNNLGR